MYRLPQHQQVAAIISFDKELCVGSRDLSELPPAAALRILDTANKTKMRALKNKAAWLTAECRKAASQQSRTRKLPVAT